MSENLVDPNEAGFSISNAVFLSRDGNTALFLKNISQKLAAFAFGNTHLHQTFTE